MSAGPWCQHCGRRVEERPWPHRPRWVHAWSQAVGCVEEGTYKVWHYLDGSICHAFPV